MTKVKIVDPFSARGQQMIRNAAFDRPATQGDPPPVEEKAVPVRPMQQWHNSKYAGEGLGQAGPFRVVLRTHRKTLERYVEIVHDEDPGGYGMTRNQLAKLIPLLQLAVERLKP